MMRALKKIRKAYVASAGALITNFRTRLIVKLWRIKVGHGVTFEGPTIIRTYEKNALTIGSDTVFVANPCKNPVGLMGPTVVCVWAGGKIVIGDHCGFSSVVLNARESMRIGSHVKVGGNVRIFDHDFHPIEADRRRVEDSHYVRRRAVVIEDDVFIGTNAIILKGTHIGARSVVAAGSVLFGLDVPPDSLVKGNPAVIVPRHKS